MEQKSPKDSTYYERTKIRKELVIQRLRERGCRITKQRQVLLDIILEQDCVSCKEMYYKANAIEPSIGMATVYRMVSLLEDIGAFDRKNMYKISCCMDCDKENACTIQFEDNTFCQLTARNWYKVISEGLKGCGYGDGKKVKCVVVEPCTNDCD
ncbi:MAG: transcriptional repressor [Lachnospiraceae bacterium]|nr:transcriptional repressor [Lachnospiraceae bacterium]